MTWWLATVSHEDATAHRVSAAGFEPALFLHERTVVKRGQLQRILRPLYPNYLFVRRDSRTNELLGVRGVRGLVRSEDDRVAEVADCVVDVRMRCAVSADSHRYVLEIPASADPSRFRVGDVVEIVNSSSWRYHRGKVSADLGEERYVIDVKLFGRYVPLSLRGTDISLVGRRRSRRLRKRALS